MSPEEFAKHVDDCLNIQPCPGVYDSIETEYGLGENEITVTGFVDGRPKDYFLITVQED